MVLQVEKNTYEAKVQEIAKQLLAATRENRSFLTSLRDQMRWIVLDFISLHRSIIVNRYKNLDNRLAQPF